MIHCGIHFDVSTMLFGVGDSALVLTFLVAQLMSVENNEINQVFAGFLYHLQFEKNNTTEDLLKERQEIDRFMNTTELPKTREEFKDRALLFALLHQIKEFLEIKAEFSAAL